MNNMTAKEFIGKYLQDCQYGKELTKEAKKIAEENNLVIIYSASDDLCELDGAIYDEVGCYDGGEVYIRPDGGIAYDKNDEEYIPSCRRIEILWCDKDAGCAWSYKTDIPHEEFLVYEDDELYCRGIVFSLDDIQPDSE